MSQKYHIYLFIKKKNFMEKLKNFIIFILLIKKN